MAEYESIHGTRVRYLTSDPTLDSSTEGQVWYNSTTGTNKALVQIKATLAGGSLAVARAGLGAAGAGTQTSSVVFGGTSAYPSTNTAATEEYNGFNWTTTGNLVLARGYGCGFGTQTAAVGAGGYVFGGGNKAEVEEYNGSTWSEVNNLPAIQRSQGSAGIQTAGLVFGGDPPPTIRTQSLEYDGTNWTSSGTLNTGRKYLAGCGTQSLALAVGGSTGAPARSAATEEYNGSSWTSGNSFTEGRSALACFGVQTHAVIAGGADPGIVNSIEEYDGTNWTTSPATLATARRYTSGFGSGTAGAIAGGSKPALANETEEYNSNINAITQSAWSSTPNINTSRRFLGGTGTATAGLVFGGFQTNPAVNIADSEEYNGSTWSEGNNLNNARRGIEGFGTQTSGVGVGGFPPPGTRTEHYDGSSWTNATAFSTARMDMFGSAGTQTAGLIFGGSSSVNTESYDGSSWSEVNNLPTGIGNARGNGTQTAALSMGGSTPAPAILDATNEWDGSNWTAGGAMLFAGSKMGAFGTQTEGYSVGGVFPARTPTNNLTQEYNGTAWAVDANIATGRNAMGPANSAGSTGLIAGGDAGPAPSNASEAFTAGTSVVTASTLTTS